MILSDTVGFISELPTQLVAAFRATLEEVLEADLIVHLRDISHPESRAQAEDVQAILAELGVGEEVPVLEAWNKLDLLAADERAARLTEAARRADTIALSAATGEGLDELVAAIAARIGGATTTAALEIPFAEGRKHAWLHARGLVEAEETGDDGWRLTVRWSGRQAAQFARL